MSTSKLAGLPCKFNSDVKGAVEDDDSSGAAELKERTF